MPIGGMGGSIHSWERGLDPWHPNAFPDEIKALLSNADTPRKSGWYALDWCGNTIGFIADDEEIELN